MKSEEIGVHYEAVVGSRGLIAVPSANPSMGLTLEVVGLPGLGFAVQLTDGMGTPIWERCLLAQDLLTDGPENPRPGPQASAFWDPIL